MDNEPITVTHNGRPITCRHQYGCSNFELVTVTSRIDSDRFRFRHGYPESPDYRRAGSQTGYGSICFPAATRPTNRSSAILVNWRRRSNAFARRGARRPRSLVSLKKWLKDGEEALKEQFPE